MNRPTTNADFLIPVHKHGRKHSQHWLTSTHFDFTHAYTHTLKYILTPTYTHN